MRTIIIYIALTLCLSNCVLSNSKENKDDIFNVYRNTIEFDETKRNIDSIKIDTDLHHYWVELSIYDFDIDYTYTKNVNNIKCTKCCFKKNEIVFTFFR